MADVSGNTLLMAVQAVAESVRAIQGRLDTGEGDPLDDTEMLMSYLRAADELRNAYEVARLASDNLPPYADVVPDDAG